MGSYNPNKVLFDPYRKKWVNATPEEKVRQALLNFMITNLGYPESLLSVESGLGRHAFNDQGRRLDIICYSPEGKPLLLIECKASRVDEKAKAQVIGYNAHIQAPFIALAAENEVCTGYYDIELVEWKFVLGLMNYHELLKRVGICC